MNNSTKKTKGIVLGALLSVALLAGCNPSAGTETHQHTFASTWSHDENQHWHVCTGEGCTEKDSVADHTPSNWIEDTPATYETAGAKHKECIVCGEVLQTETIPMKQHNFSTDWEKNETQHWHKCTEDGCTEKDSVADHNFGQWTVTQDATYEAEGSKTRECLTCGYIETEAIQMLVHHASSDWSKDENYHWHACEDVGCDELLDKAEHVWDDGVETTTHSCSSDGEITYTCECGATKTEVVPAHDLVHIDEVPAGCTTDGVLAHDHCNTCGENFIDGVQKTDNELKLSQTGHAESQNYTSDATHHWKTCTNDGCNEVIGKAEHTWDAGVVETAATLMEDGVKKYTCEVCSATKTEVIEKVAPSMWIEAENCNLVGSVNNKPFACSNVIKTHEDAHGGQCLYNFSTAEDTVTMVFEASAAGTVRMDLVVAKRPKTLIQFDEKYSTTVNGSLITTGIELPKGPDGDYFDFMTASTEIEVVQGDNTIILSNLDGTVPNLDAFGFASDTITFTDKTVKNIFHSESLITVTKNPTSSEEGAYVIGCKDCQYGHDDKTYTLPALNESDYTKNGSTYTIELTNSEGQTETFEFSDGQEYVFECEDMLLKDASGTVLDNAEYTKADGDALACSNGKALMNMAKENYTVTMSFVSDKATTAIMSVNVAARRNSQGKGYDKKFGETQIVTINGGDPIVYEAMINTNNGNGKSLTSYYEMHLIVLGEINIIEGLNTIVFKATGNASNLDCVKLFTSAVLTAPAE